MNKQDTETTKSYYLPRWRSMIVGIILIVFGFAINLIGIDLDNSIWENLQWIFINFSSFNLFIFSLLALAFKLAFIIGGYLYIKYSDKVERARLDAKGFHYREIPNGSRLNKLGMDAGPLSFTSYKSIRDISYKKTFWGGAQLYLTLADDLKPLTALGVLNDEEKQEIVATVKAKIENSHAQTQR